MNNEEAQKLEACGDGLLLAAARLYLRDRHPDIPYACYTRLVGLMVNNKQLARLADREGIKGLTNGRTARADAFEMEIAARYYRSGWGSVRAWLWSLFDEHLNIEEEARRMLDPSAADRLLRQVRGALKQTIQQHGGRITGESIEAAAAQIVAQLRDGHHPT